MTIGVPIVAGLPRLYQRCTNRQKQLKQSKDSQSSKNDHWCTNRHRSTKTVPTVYQSSKTVKNSQKTVKTAKMTIGVQIVTCLHRVRRIHKSALSIHPNIYFESDHYGHTQKGHKTHIHTHAHTHTHRDRIK